MSDNKSKDDRNKSDINYKAHSSRKSYQNKDKDYCYGVCNKDQNKTNNKVNNKSMDESINRKKEFKNEDKLKNERTFYGRDSRRHDSYSRNSSHFKNNERPENVNKCYNNSSKSVKTHENHNNSDKDFVKTSDNLEPKQNHSNYEERNVETIDSNYSKKEDESSSDLKTVNIDNYDQQIDEITALKSIFDEKVLTIDETQLRGRFLAEPVLNKSPFLIVYRNYYSRENNKTEQFFVEHLPPIELYFELPENYPSKSNPKFLISCKWLTLSDLDLICGKLEQLWNESKMEILYTWFSFLQNESLNWLKYNHKLDITSLINIKPKWVTKSETNSSKPSDITTVSKLAVSQHRNRNIYRPLRKEIQFRPQLYRGNGTYDMRAACDLIGADLITHLKAYNEYKQKDIFNKTYINCNICFTSNLGEDCVVFPCDHIHCKKCIKDYFTTLVTEGSVNSLKCPQLKCDTSAPPELVRELISPDLFKRYDELLLASVIGSMTDVYYCPRKACGSLVIAESDSSLAHCSSCGYAFCKNCKFSFHGLDPCQIFRNPKERKEILDKYREATDNEKLQIEKQYGKKQLISALEEAATEKWIEDMSKPCPHCKASIEKSDGCNKMSCWRCNTFFCWLCLTQLPTTFPYSHFNNPASKCFNQLFRGVNFDEMDDLFEDIVP